MRDTVEWIDNVAETNEDLGQALYDLVAHQIATQAFVIAAKRFSNLSEDDAARLVELVAGYPGVTSRRMRSDSNTLVGTRAKQILLSLFSIRP